MVRLLRLAMTALLGVAMIAVGVLHFVDPTPFERIVPSAMGAPRMWVLLSGAFEIAGGAGLLWRRTRRAAGFGLIALFVAVFPANINMAINEIQLEPRGTFPVWAMWARLPVQALFIAWAYWVAISRASRTGDVSPSGD